MDTLEFLLAAIRAAPGDELAWLALADGLEESGQAERAELARLTRRLAGLTHDDPARALLEPRLQELLAAGTRPCVPETTNSVGMRFVLVPPGTSWMGSPDSEPGRYDDEALHPVTLTRGFWMLACQVAQAAYTAVTGDAPWTYAGTGLPAHCVNFDDALAFCARLSELPEELRAGRRYRLPTEAEWEYACRAGTTSEYHFGDEIGSAQAAFNRSGEAGPMPVGSYPPNAFGLHDMHGNAWEWVSDWFDSRYYERSPSSDPPGPESGSVHVIRGGSWSSTAGFCRSACREYASNESNRPRDGLRVVMELHAKP